MMVSARFLSTNPSCRFASAAACFTMAAALINACSARIPLIGKFSAARAVWIP
jgi:hypothetical protein